MRIFPDPDNVPDGQVMNLYVGQTLNCTASGRPDPEFFWRKIEGNGAEICELYASIQAFTLKSVSKINLHIKFVRIPICYV